MTISHFLTNYKLLKYTDTRLAQLNYLSDQTASSFPDGSMK
jgi:hypothetical protein